MMKMLKGKRQWMIFVILAGILLLYYIGTSYLPQVKSISLYLSQFVPKPTPKTQIRVGKDKVRLIDEESAVIDVIEKVSASVVTVGVIREQPIFEFEPFNPFDPFNFFQIPRQRGTKKEESDIGSGFIISEDGLVVTNKHVVNNTSYEYQVITSDNKTHKVEKIYRDPANDLAILKIKANGLTPVTLGNSDNLKVGQTVIALGTPLGEFRGTATKGIVSGLGRGITAGSPFEGVAEELDNVIQTDAAINPGNSGGPLVNTSAQVIGINTAVASGAENIGFALPINIVRDAINNFQKTGSFERAFLGVSYRMITRELSVVNDIPEGAYVLDVIDGSAADKAGIEKGDIIIKIDGERIKGDEKNSLAKKIQAKKKGDTVILEIWRDGKTVEKRVTLGTFDEN